MMNEVRKQALVLITLVVCTNVGLWIGCGVTLSALDQGSLLGTSALAYTLGLRHGFDADHICAIDNVVRRLMQLGQKPVSVGTFFSLGHSTVVIVSSTIVIATMGLVKANFEEYHQVGTVIGTSVAATFLMLIAFLNFISAFGLYKELQRMKATGGEYRHEDQVEELIGGAFTPCLKSTLKLVDKPWKIYPLGLLFGLGFDTSAEVILLSVSAIHSPWVALFFPFLFTAGMCLVDTIDGIVMLGIYDFANDNPARKLFYNLVITAFSVVIAFSIASIQILGLIAHAAQLSGGFWDFVGVLSDNFVVIGVVLVSVFILTFLFAAIYYKRAGIGSLVRTMDNNSATMSSSQEEAQEKLPSPPQDLKTEVVTPSTTTSFVVNV